MVTLELMKAISAAFNSRDVDRIVAFFAEDGVFCLARGPETVGRTLAGKAVIRKALTDRFAVIPDMRWENEQYILAPEANRAISVWTVRGKGSDGDNGNGFPFSGRYTLDELELLRLGPMSIKRRVRTLGGDMVLDSKPGQGAGLKIRLAT